MTNSNSTQLYNTHSNCTAQTIKFRQTLINLRGRRKKGREMGDGGGERKARKRGKVKYPLPSLPNPLPFPLPPYPLPLSTPATQAN